MHRIQTSLLEHLGQVATERLGPWQEHKTLVGLNVTGSGRRPVDIVEQTIRILVLALVQTVEAEQLDQRHAAGRGEIPCRNTPVVTGIHDVESEILPAELIGIERIDVLHHQIPKRGIRIQHGRFQQLDNQYLRILNSLIGKFPYLIHGTVSHNLVLIGNRQDLVVVQALVQGDETQLGVQGIFAGIQTPGAFHFLEFASVSVSAPSS